MCDRGDEGRVQHDETWHPGAKKGPGARHPTPSLSLGFLEVEAECADDLVPVDARLIVRIAILGPQIGMLAEPKLDAGAGTNTVEIAVIGEVGSGARGAVLIGHARPGI